MERPKFNPNRPPEEYCFDNVFLQLLIDHPFLGATSMYIDRGEDWDCDTVYVTIDKEKKRLRIGYNPEFLASLPKVKQRIGVFMHELAHVILRHILERANNSEYWNIAADLAVNCIVGENNLPEIALYPGRIPLHCSDPGMGALIASFPVDESADYYLAKLEAYAKKKKATGGDKPQNSNGSGGVPGDKAQQSNTPGNNSGKGANSNDKTASQQPGSSSIPGSVSTLDDHSGWGNSQGTENGPGGEGELDELTRSLIDAQIEQMIEEGCKRTTEKKAWGNTPAALRCFLERPGKPEINWRALVKQFFGKARGKERTTSIRKINKRMPWVFPGAKRKPTAKFVAFVDQSGSMSNDDVQLCIKEVWGCSRETEIEIFNFDVEIDETSYVKLRRGQEIQWKRTRCGGTNFNSIMNFVNQPKQRAKGWTGVIILTDGYAAAMGQIFGAKVLWIVTPHGQKPENLRPGDMVVQLKKS